MGILVPKAVKARQFLVDAFKKHHRGDYSDAAEVTKERIRVMQEYGVPEDDLARMQLSFNIALLPNTVPTAFWTLFNTFSRPELLQKLRAELVEHAISRDETGQRVELDVTAVKSRCPNLLSVFEETQRTLTVHANIRKVQKDTMLSSFHLKKGSYLQIPNQPIHFNNEVWGDEPTVFNPRRFFKDDGSPLRSSLPSNSFLAWGAAPYLCPARQFASTEILVMAALLILRVDMEPIGGHWRRPRPKIGELTTVLSPIEEVEVELKPRDGWNGNWILKMGESRSKVPLASG
jgi:cytochrome P450